MENVKESSITPESVLAAVKEMFAASSERTDRESERLDRELQKSREEFEQKRAISNADFDRRMKELSKQIGGMANSDGDFAEEFFFNALYHGQRKMFGEVFDDVVKRNKVTINKGYEDEYDILMVNGRAVCIVEVKFKADSGDLPHKVARKAETFRVNFPQHKDKKVYLAIAGMSFHPLTEKACADNGIAVMKQVGEAMVVSEENLKTF